MMYSRPIRKNAPHNPPLEAVNILCTGCLIGCCLLCKKTSRTISIANQCKQSYRIESMICLKFNTFFFECLQLLQRFRIQ